MMDRDYFYKIRSGLASMDGFPDRAYYIEAVNCKGVEPGTVGLVTNTFHGALLVIWETGEEKAVVISESQYFILFFIGKKLLQMEKEMDDFDMEEYIKRQVYLAYREDKHRFNTRHLADIVNGSWPAHYMYSLIERLFYEGREGEGVIREDLYSKVVSPSVQGEVTEETLEGKCSLDYDLPYYLENGIAQYEEHKKSPMRDSYYYELESNINMALADHKISTEQAAYLRMKYLGSFVK